MKISIDTSELNQQASHKLTDALANSKTELRLTMEFDRITYLLRTLSRLQSNSVSGHLLHTFVPHSGSAVKKNFGKAKFH